MKKQIETAKDFIAESDELRTKRLLMGLKAIDFCKDHGLNQGNYSKMERGMAKPTQCLVLMNNIFECWKKDRIENLECEIKKLKSIK